MQWKTFFFPCCKMDDTHIIVVNVYEWDTGSHCFHFLGWHLDSFSVARISPTSSTFVLLPHGFHTPGKVRPLLPWLAVVWFGKFIGNTFKVNALTKSVGNGLCSVSKRHKSKGGSQADYAETESLTQISRPCTFPWKQKITSEWSWPLFKV